MLALILAAAEEHETSKVSFYVLGTALAVWAVGISALGIRNSTLVAARPVAITGITALLVIGAMVTSVITG